MKPVEMDTMQLKKMSISIMYCKCSKTAILHLQRKLQRPVVTDSKLFLQICHCLEYIFSN